MPDGLPLDRAVDYVTNRRAENQPRSYIVVGYGNLTRLRKMKQRDKSQACEVFILTNLNSTDKSPE